MARPDLEKFALFLKLDRGLSPRTVEAYVSDVRLFESSLSATRAQIQQYLEQLTRQGLNNRSLARKLSSLRLYYSLALAEGWRQDDPSLDLESPKLSRPLPKILSLDEVDQLLEAPRVAGANGDAIMLRVLYASGLRVTELIELAPEQADLQTGVLRVQGKGGKIRIVPIDPETAAMVDLYLKEIRPQLRAKGPQQSQETLFVSRQGAGFTRQGFWKLVKKYALLAGIPSAVSPHILRHAFATHLLERGMNLRSLQMLLGHSDISTTEIYSHVTTSHLREALLKHHPKAKG